MHVCLFFGGRDSARVQPLVCMFVFLFLFVFVKMVHACVYVCVLVYGSVRV
jgi:hypothetical protein